MATSKRWARIVRFKLRTLLLLMFAASVAFGLYMRAVRRQQKAVAAVKRLGGDVYYDFAVSGDGIARQAQSPVAAWLLSGLGEDYFHDVAAVWMGDHNSLPEAPSYLQEMKEFEDDLRWLDGFPDLEKLDLYTVKVNDNSLKNIGRLRRLRDLHISNCSQVTDAGMRHLGELRRLQFLSLWSDLRQMTDAEMRPLGQLRSLETLYLDFSTISDDSLAVLTRLPNLKFLSLDYTDITDQGMKHFEGMNGLHHLSIGDNQITDAGLVHLQGLTGLQELYLDGNPIASDGLFHLKGLTNLETLGLRGTLVDNEGLKHLVGLKNLSSICLVGTRVTDASALQQALPNCWMNLRW